MINRREMMTKSIIGAGSALFAGKTMASCVLTPEQTEGPFYLIEDQADKDNDLTKVRGNQNQARGEIVVLKGVVRDANCQPVEGVMVEIWQACHTGKYNHPGDPNFQYWGRAITNVYGQYSFKTIRPGQYQATRDWIRPAHIHMKVHKRGFGELTTQVYFKDDRLNQADRILQSLTKQEQGNVVVDFQPGPSGHKEGSFDGHRGEFSESV